MSASTAPRSMAIPEVAKGMGRTIGHEQNTTRKFDPEISDRSVATDVLFREEPDEEEDEEDEQDEDNEEDDDEGYSE